MIMSDAHSLIRLNRIYTYVGSALVFAALAAVDYWLLVAGVGGFFAVRGYVQNHVGRQLGGLVSIGAIQLPSEEEVRRRIIGDANSPSKGK